MIVHYFIKNPVVGGIDYKNDWELVIPNSNGIGVNLDLDFKKLFENYLIILSLFGIIIV